MLFNSHIFLFLYLPLTAIVFFRLGAYSHRLAAAWLGASSLFFYGYWNPAYVGLLLASIFFNYGIGFALAREYDAGNTRRKNIILALGVGADLVLLGYYKYANFFLGTANNLLDAGWSMQDILLPLGISFFTFTQIAFLVDAWSGKAREFNFIHYLLFVTYFPHLIAGPVLHHKEMMPQFAQPETYRVSWENMAVGLTFLFAGMFKKVIIADSLAPHATPVFAAAEAGQELSFFEAWKGTVAYTLQLYFDFSGYSDMAIGLSRMFGVKLPLNFNSPYQAVNIVEFWRRWHMTLSRFLRDYLYIPLGGNRHGPGRRYLNLLATMLLGGLWHGAGWTFVVWGCLHGLYLVINHAWQKLWVRPIGTWWSRAIARSITLLAVMVAWVFFRAESFEGAMHMLQAMANLPTTLHGRIGPVEGWLGALGIRFQGGHMAAEHLVDLAWLAFWIAFLWLLPNTQQWMARFQPSINVPEADLLPPAFPRFWQRLQWQPTPAWALVTVGLAVISVLSLSRISEFLYFQF
jgi:D-alanyl-lipoteichoic acid acyltransferase DltB (MBOAT superfamily)